ncbi:hypothetical protein [Pseudooceanicola batsensis]|uniref:hypothetical protein n=1 Tax=Pseudooceanicola batsensis TaxID=314255 RepID=UPI0011D246C5|nr:hypothetical protein [Pseudooceanicola batsensis]
MRLLAPPLAGFARLPHALRSLLRSVRGRVGLSRDTGRADLRTVARLSTQQLGDRLGLTVVVGHPDARALRPHLSEAVADWQAQDWDRLGPRLARFDRCRAALPSGERIAPALSRALFRHIAGPAACTLIDRGRSVPSTDLPEDLFAPLQRILGQQETDPALHFLAAQVQLELGWARRGDDYADFALDEALSAAQARFRVARTVLDRIAPRAPHSSHFAELDYRVRAAEGTTEEELTQAAIRWSRTDTTALAPYALHGLHLLPRWYGTEGSLRAFADKSWAKTHENMGAAAYAAVYLAALESDLETALTLDLAVFREGLIDMMQLGEDPDLTCNAVLRLLWEVSLAPSGIDRREPRAVRGIRHEMRALFYDLARHALGPVMPDVWGGRWTEARILHTLAEPFAEELAAGRTVSIGLQGAMVSE